MGKYTKGKRHNEDQSGQKRSKLRIVTLCVHDIIKKWSKLKTPRRRYQEPKIITSIARFYVYYHMKRFLRDSDKMQRFITKEMTETVQANIPTKKIWEDTFQRGKEIIATWLAEQPNKPNIRYARYERVGSVGGVL